MKYFYELPDSLIEEQEQFGRDIKQFVMGHINPIQFKAIRVAHGVYEQRQNHTYMIRIRCAAGGINPHQLRKVAHLAETYGNGEVHVTTRQEVQIHDVLIEDVMKVITELREVNLSSRGGGGNTIRNILTPPTSGVDHQEVFDVDPHAIALTTRLIAEKDSWNLPRKFKIAFSFNEKDTSYTQATCLGFLAEIRNGQKGFKVYCAGGMGAKPMVGNLLLDFVPGEKIYQVAKSLKRMFDKHGNRKSKTTSRIKFLWKKLQREEFEKLFFLEFNKIKDDASLDLKIVPLENGIEPTDIDLKPEKPTSEHFSKWVKRFTAKQKQAGFYIVKIPLRLGDFLKEDVDKLVDFLTKLPQEGNNTIRCDRAQNVILRNIPERYLGNLFNIITTFKQTLVDFAPFVANMINCTGASTCKLGICLPRGLSDAIRKSLAESKLDLDELDGFRLNMSGCPNTCGMHHVAHLGFFGKVGRKDGNMFPAYNVLLGARIGFGKTQYAKKYGEIAAHQIPSFVSDFLEHYLARKKDHLDYYEYLEKEGIDFTLSKLEKYNQLVPTLEENENYYRDFGAKKRLSLSEIGTAECSAGMFDMIGVDKKIINKNLKVLNEKMDSSDLEKEVIYQLIFSTARMLLVTRGLEGRTPSEVFEQFRKHFVITNLVSTAYENLLLLAKKKDLANLLLEKKKVIDLAGEVLALYASMDDSLRFKKEKMVKKS